MLKTNFSYLILITTLLGRYCYNHHFIDGGNDTGASA